MRTKKAMATALDGSRSMAKNNLQLQSYIKQDYLSNQIDYLLAGFLFVLQANNISASKQATALGFIDRLLRFKIDLKQIIGVHRDC